MDLLSTHDGGLDQDALDLVDVHPPHHGLGYGGDGGHGSGLVLYSGNILVINYTFHTGPYFNYKDPMYDYRQVRIFSFIS